LRKKRAAILQLIFLGACFLAAWAVWPKEGVYSQNSQNAHHLFTVLGFGQLGLVALFAPAFTSPAFTMEKERNTFDLIYGTHMSPFAIVWGKVSGAITFLLLVILSSIPVVSVCLVLGGISYVEVGWFYVVLVLTALFFGMIGLTVSALSEKTYVSVIITYIIIGLVAIGALLPSLFFMPKVGGNLKTVLHWIWSCSPLIATANVVQEGLLLRVNSGLGELTAAHQIFAGFAAICSVSMMAGLFLHLRKCPAPKPRRERVIDEAITERLSKWPFYLINPRGHRRMLGAILNPVFVKELRTMLFGRLVYLVRAFYICVIVSVALMLVAAIGSFVFPIRAIAIFTVSFQMVLILFLGPIFSAPLISREIENGHFDLLRLTKLRSLKIVAGKFESVILPLAILMVATLPPYLMLGYVKPEFVPGILRSSATLLVTLIFVCSAGIFFSSMCRKTSSSIAGTYTVVVLTCVMSLFGLLAAQSIHPDVLQKIFVINPVVTMLSETALTDLRETYDLWLPNLYILGGSIVVLLFVASLRVAMLVRPR
ncbi:MAG: ABC transporter permease, partial [Planctomycetes bacterium]|nr:ABC transporter permease [Planctomycetota bacterium]